MVLIGFEIVKIMIDQIAIKNLTFFFLFFLDISLEKMERIEDVHDVVAKICGATFILCTLLLGTYLFYKYRHTNRYEL